MSSSKYIVDIIGDVVESMRLDNETPYYLYGHPTEVVNTLAEWTKAPMMKDKKFPIVILFQDFEEDKGRNMAHNSSVSLNLVICTSTKREYKSADRYENTFKPVLYPLYDLFMQKLATSGYFFDIVEGYVPHVKVDRVFWGKDGLYGNTGNMFNDFIDAIEIKNLELTILNTN